MDALFACHEQLLATVRQFSGKLVWLAMENRGALLKRLRQVENVAAFKVANIAYVVHASKRRPPLFTQNGVDLVGRPGVKQSFVAFAIRVFRAKESTGRTRHIAND